MAIELILGGARSGKSHFAQQRAQTLTHHTDRQVCVVATAQALDAEMALRIAHHKATRPAHWTAIEAPLRLAATLAVHARAERVLIVDCITLWLTNVLLAADGSGYDGERQALLDTLPSLPGDVLLVSNEIGLGVVPMGELTRRFVDEHGRLNQALAQRADRVTLVAAGLPLTLKG